MKSIKHLMNRKFFAIVTLGLILSFSTYDVYGCFGHHKPGHGHGHDGSCNVGAPLDGGLLTVLLGGAGIAYFARKKKKNQE
jgi:hypothetical protein